MPLFKSNRERNLWFAALILIVSIMATLGLACPLTTFLSDTGLLPLFFILGILLVIVTALTRGFIRKPQITDFGLVLGIIAVYLLVFVRMEMPLERTHLIEYGILAIFIHEALNERASHGKKLPYSPLIAIGITACFGAIDEGIQAIIPGRVFDIRDILFNALAGFMTVGVSSAILSIISRIRHYKRT